MHIEITKFRRQYGPDERPRRQWAVELVNDKGHRLRKDRALESLAELAAKKLAKKHQCDIRRINLCA